MPTGSERRSSSENLRGVARVLAMRVPMARTEEKATIVDVVRVGRDSRGGEGSQKSERRAPKPKPVRLYLNPLVILRAGIWNVRKSKSLGPSGNVHRMHHMGYQTKPESRRWRGCAKVDFVINDKPDDARGSPERTHRRTAQCQCWKSKDGSQVNPVQAWHLRLNAPGTSRNLRTSVDLAC